MNILFHVFCFILFYVCLCVTVCVWPSISYYRISMLIVPTVEQVTNVVLYANDKYVKPVVSEETKWVIDCTTRTKLSPLFPHGKV